MISILYLFNLNGFIKIRNRSTQKPETKTNQIQTNHQKKTQMVKSKKWEKHCTGADSDDLGGGWSYFFLHVFLWFWWPKFGEGTRNGQP